MDDETRDVIWSWAVREVAPWTTRGLDARSATPLFADMNQTYLQAHVFEISDGRVILWPKPAGVVRPSVFTQRGDIYLKFFQAVVDRWRPDLAVTFCMSLADGPLPGHEGPSFAFQKTGGDELLLPDLDFIRHGFYEDDSFADHLPYLDKAAKAIFVGSTTGGKLTREVVSARSLPRLQAAEFFIGSSLVDFRLPSIVQYKGDQEVRALMAEAPYCRPGFVAWADQLKNRLLISMDGNGATCSRVVLALKSNSVLLKYASASKLFYFEALTPWTHYLPIDTHQGVEDIVITERDHPGAFEHVARASTRFAALHLNREAVEYYTASVLTLYQGCFAPS